MIRLGLPLLAAALLSGCQAHAAKPAGPTARDYEDIRRRAEESHEDHRSEETGKPRARSEAPRPTPAPEAPRVEAARKVSPPAEAKKRPDWADGASAQYPRESFLVGVGIADERSASEDRARAEISKIFSTEVTAQTALSETETNLQMGGKTENTFSQSIAQGVQTTSKKVLEGALVVEHWQDASTREHFSLAVLDRARASHAIRDKISDFDRQSEQYRSQMDSASDKFTKVKAALKLLAVLKARASLNGDLRVVDPSGETVPGPVDEAAVRPQASQAVSELDVVVDMSGGTSTEVETGIVKGLNGLGLQAKSGAGSAADIVVEGKVETNPIQIEGDKWKWARSTVTLSLKDGRTSKIFVRFDSSNRQASADYKEAVRRSHVALAKKVAEQINEAITSYFENQ